MVVNPTRRPRTKRAHSGAIAAFLMLFLLGPGAWAADGAEASGPSQRGFEPALMIGFGVHAQDLRGSQSADFVDVPRGRQGKLRFSFGETAVALFSPTLTETLGLRLFLHGGGQFPFTPDQVAENSRISFDVNREGPVLYAANCALPPDNEPGRVTPGFELATGGTGFCEIRGRNETIVNHSLFAGLGADFTLPLGSYQFHLRPSLNWFGQSMHGKAMTLRKSTLSRKFNCTSRVPIIDGMQCNDPTPNVAGVDVADVYSLSFERLDEVRSETGDRWMHGIGPRLELDIEVARVGNMVFEFFAQAGIYWILTDRTITHSGSGTIGDGTCTQRNPNFLDPNFPAPNFCSAEVPGGQPIRAFYKTEAGPYVVQGGGGFRVVWRGIGL